MPRKKKEALTEVSARKKTTAARPQGSKTQKKFDFKTFYQGIQNNIQKNRFIYTRYLVILGVVIVIGAIAFVERAWIVVAVVNNEPITTAEYYSNLKSKDAGAVLDQLIRDRIINQEANKKGISVASSDIDKKVADVEKQVGGKEQLKSALTSRNITDSEFRNQIKIQLLVEKLLASDIQISDKEITDYITKNQNTDPSVLGVNTKDRAAVKTQLQSDKLNAKFQGWYDSLQKKSSIIKF